MAILAPLTVGHALRDGPVTQSVTYEHRLSASRRAARSLLIAAALLLVAHLGFGAYCEADPKRKDPTFGDKLAKLETRPGDKPLVLMLGSSRTLLGFDAGLVESENPELRAFNFGTPASGPITQLVYLKRLLNAGIIPDLLLLEVLPPALADGQDGPGEQSFLTGERLSRSEVELVEAHGFRREPLRAAWRESVYSPASALRFQLIGRAVPSWIEPKLRSDWSRSTDARGWTTPPRQSVTAEERAERTANAAAEYRATLANMEVEGRPLAALREVLELCRDRGIATRVVVLPEAATFQSLYPPGLADRIAAALAAVAQENGSCLVDARDWLTESDFYDGHHLFRRGAERFTRRLSDTAIRPHFAGIAR